MAAPATKAEQPKAPAPADRSATLQSSSRITTAFADNRPAAAAHRQQQTQINNSPRMQRAAASQALIAQSPRQQAVQLQAVAAPVQHLETPAPVRKNNTGLPDKLKAGVESLSGYSLDDVQVHYNSAKPAQLHAHAYAQGTDIHVAPGQAHHLPHEAWHVVQQKQGRVRPTRQLKGKVSVNDDAGLEKEADVMGELSQKKGNSQRFVNDKSSVQMTQVLQCVLINAAIEFDDNGLLKVKGNTNPENKAGVLNAMKLQNAIADNNLNAHYHNGHMVAAMFGGNNEGDNIRVWSDTYENVHSNLEKQVRYGFGAVAKPQANEEGTISVASTEQNNLFDLLTNSIYDRIENQLNRRGFWKNGKLPDSPKGAMIAGLKGANVDMAVGAIPTSVRFKYNETTGGGRTIDATQNDGFGQPGAGDNSQHILQALGRFINNLVPNGDAQLHMKSPEGKKRNALLADIQK